jgi:3-dehydroquinate synthase
MGDLPVPNTLQIKSYKGDYKAEFVENALAEVGKLPIDKTQLIVDSLVYELYKKQFEQYLGMHKKIFIVASEDNKNLDQISSYIFELVKHEVKIDHTLVAIGGGIIQDITCFIATTLFRGMKWAFIPTTLLAQADSCIGSKSSINVGEFKNLVGTFNPPAWILIDLNFLKTLKSAEIYSGLGEIFKVHMIKGIEYFEKALQAYDQLRQSPDILKSFIQNSLIFKKEFIELDEFDKGPRNVMNYGHSFGHAIESATNFTIPHGISVTIGMDMANFQSYKMGRIKEEQFLKWHQGLALNYKAFQAVIIDLNLFLSAIQKDKKNIGKTLSLILVRDVGSIEKIAVANDQLFKDNCSMFFKQYFNEVC